MKKALLLFFCLLMQFAVFSQDGTGRSVLGKEYAKRELTDALKNTDKKNVLVDKVIKNKSTAINVTEAMVFSIYGKENIVRQQPYESYLIDGYWIIGGTLPKGWDGGTFLIIINSADGKVVRLTHGQ